MEQKRIESLRNLISQDTLKWLMDPQNKSGFHTEEQALEGFDRYMRGAGGDPATANANMANDFGAPAPGTTSQQAVVQPAAQPQPPLEQPSQAASDSVATQGPMPPPPIEDSLGAVQGAIQHSAEQSAAALQQTAMSAPGESGPIKLESPLRDSRMSIGNPLVRVGFPDPFNLDKNRYPRTEAIERGTPVDMGNYQPGWSNYKSALDDIAQSRDVNERGEKLNRVEQMFRNFWDMMDEKIGPKLDAFFDRTADSKYAPDENALRQSLDGAFEMPSPSKMLENLKGNLSGEKASSIYEQMDYHKRMMDKSNDSAEAKHYRETQSDRNEAWRAYSKYGRSLMRDMPVTLEGWTDVAQAYLWGHFNSALMGAGDLGRGVSNLLPGVEDDFWLNPRNPLYVRQTSVTQAGEAVGRATGMFTNAPFKISSNLVGRPIVAGLGKGLGAADKVAGGKIASGIERALMKPGLSHLDRAYYRVSQLNPIGSMMGSAGTLTSKIVGRAATSGFGKQLVGSEAGQSVIRGVSEIVGSNTMRRWLGSKTSERIVEEVSEKAIRRMAAQQWQSTRLSPLRRGIENQYVLDTQATMVTAYAANVRKELGKVLGDVDDATMNNLVEKMVNNFTDYMAANPNLTAIIKHPFGASKFARALQAVGPVDTMSRAIVDGALEGVGFGVMHLAGSIGPLFDQSVASMEYGNAKGADKAIGIMKMTTKNWFDQNFKDTSSEGHVIDSMTMGFIFGTKGLGVGHLPWVRDRNFSNMRDAWRTARAKGYMTPGEHLNQLTSEGHAVLMDRVEKVFKRANIPFDQQASFAEQLTKITDAAKAGKVSPRAVRRIIKEMRGNLEGMSNKDLAMMAALSRENAARFPTILRDGRIRPTTYENIRDEDITLLWQAPDEAMSLLAKEKRQHIIRTLESENRALELAYKGETGSMFVEDLAKSSVVAGAIFLETGGLHMIEALQDDENVGADEIANLITHSMFSFMAGSHNRYSQEIPDQFKGSILDAKNIPHDLPSWVKNRVRLSALQAQLHYGGKEVHPFIQHMAPEINAQSVHLAAATGAMSQFVSELGTHMANTQAGSRSFFAVDDIKRPGTPLTQNIVPEGSEPITQNELNHALVVLRALVSSGVKLPKSFTLGGMGPEMGQEYIDFINNQDNRGAYLGHVAYALRRMAQTRGYLREGEEFTADTFYRMTRLSAQRQIGEIAQHVDYAGIELARLMKGISPGRSDVLSSARFDNNQELTDQVADLIELTSVLQTRYEVLKPEGSSMGASVKPGGDTKDAVLRIGRNAMEIKGLDPTKATKDELISAAELAVAEIVEQFHRGIHGKPGVSKELRLGTPNGELKNSLYDAVELTGRFIAGELFHFRTDGGVAIRNSGGKRATVDGVLQAAEAAGLFSMDRLSDARGRRILRPISREFLDKLMQENPVEAIRLLWLHDTLSSMTDLVYTVSEDTGRQISGMTISSDESSGRGAGLNPISLSKLNSRQDAGVRVPDAHYNLMSHKGGFWEALADAGIVITSREGAARITSDLDQLRDLRLSESDALGMAAIKQHRLAIKESGRLRLIAPQVIIQQPLGVRGITGPDGLIEAIRAMRVANKDAATPTEDETGSSLNGAKVGPYGESPDYKLMMLDAILKRRVQDLDGAAIQEEVFRALFGVNLNEYIALGERLIKEGRVDSWSTDNGMWNGTPLSFDTRVIMPDGQMPLLEMALRPIPESGARRAKIVEDMMAKLKGAGLSGDNKKITKDVTGLTNMLQSLMRIGDRSSLMRVSYLLEGVGSIKIMDDGKSVFTLNVRRLSQEQVSKMLDRLENLEMGKGDFASVMAKYDSAVRDARTSDLGRRLLTDPEHNRGVTFTKLMKDMRISSVLAEKYMQMFREVADSVLETAASGNLDAEATVDSIISQFRRIFYQAGENSVSGGTIAGPVEKWQHEAGMRQLVAPGSVSDHVTKSLQALSRTDYIGLFNEVAETESVYKITASDARALKLGGRTIPVRGGNGDANIEQSPAFDTITEGAFSLRRERRKRDIERAFLDSVGAELSIDLDSHDSVTNTSLISNRVRLKQVTDLLYAHGLERPLVPGSPNAIDEASRPTLKEGREAGTAKGTYGHLADRTPIVVLPWGDNKLIAIQVPKDAAGIVKMMTTGKRAWDATADTFPRERREFTDLYDRLMNGDGTAKYASMAEAIAAGVVTKSQLYNVYAHIMRSAVHGAAVSGPEGGRRYSMSGAGSIESNKRYNQLSSDSYRKLSDVTFSLAVGELLSRRGQDGKPLVTEKDLESYGISRQSNGTYKIRVQLVAESSKRARGGVKELDGNIEVAKNLMDLMAVASGYDPSVPSEISPGMMWGGWKGFIFGQQPDGFNFMTKSFMTVMDGSRNDLARSQRVAMFVPFSSIKIGTPEAGGKYIYRGQPITHTEAAARMARGQKVELDPNSPNIIEISPSDLKFQAMHDPNKVMAVVTAQMTQGWSPEGIKALLDDPSIFPAKELEDYAKIIFDRGIMGQAQLRSFYERARVDGPIVSPDDVVLGAVSGLDLVMMSRHGTASIMYDKQMRQALVKVARDRLAKGSSRHGGGAAMAPDFGGDLGSTEINLGPQARRSLVSIGRGLLGVQRTKKLVITKGKDGSVEIRSVDFTHDDADAHQRETYGHREGRSWNYNKAVESELPESVADRATTWVDEGITQRFRIDRNGNIHGFLANIIAEAYGGGLKRNGEQAGFSAPIYELFNRESGHVREADFESATRIVNDVFVDVISTRDGEAAANKIEAARNGLLGIIKTAEGKRLVDKLMSEMLWASNRARRSSNMFENIGPDDFGFGMAASRDSKDVGDITAGDLMDFMDAIVGGRTSGGSMHDADGNTRSTGYDYSKRFITDAGEDLNDGAGLTPVRYGITGALQRSPSAKYNDTVPFHLLGFLDGKHGGIGIVNRFDAVDAMEADYDYDTFKYMFALPRESMRDIVRVRNGIGPLGSQKGDNQEDGHSYTYFSDGDTYGAGNKHLEYIEGQHKAAILKGQIISARAVLDKMILDGRGFRYSIGPEGQKRTYELTPKYTLDEMQSKNMGEMMQIYRIIQKVLDTPGAMLPRSFRVRNARGEEIGEPIDLWNLDVDKELFGRLYQKRLVQGEGLMADKESPSDTILGDSDLNVLRAVRSLIHRTSSLVRDDRSGDEDVSRSTEDVFGLARTYAEVFGDRLAGEKGGRNREDALRGYIRDNAEGVSSDVLASISTFRTTNDSGSAYVDRLANWYTRLGDAVAGESAIDGTASSKTSRALASEITGDSTTLDGLRAMARVPEIKKRLQWLQSESDRLGPNMGMQLQGEIKRLNLELEKAVSVRSNLLGAPLRVNERSIEGRALQRHLVDGTIMGYALKMTALGIDDSLDPRLSALADASARNVIVGRRQMWGIAMSAESPKLQKGIKPDMIQDILDVVVDNYFRQFPAEVNNQSTFNQLAIRLLQPTANALYRHQGQDFLSYERMSQDLLNAIVRHNPDMGAALLRKINENVLLMSDVFSGDPVVGTVAMRDQIAAIKSHDGRMGERRTMLRNILRGLDIDSPIEAIMEENMTQRGVIDPDGIGEDGIVPAGARVRGASRLLVDSVRALASFEGGRGRFVDVSLRVDPAASLDIPILREMFGKEWGSALIAVNSQQASLTQRQFYRNLFSDAVDDVVAARPVGEYGRSKAPPGDSEMAMATKKANEQFATIISKVSAAVTDASKTVASRAIIRDPNFDIRRMSNRSIYLEQARIEREDQVDKNCGGGF